MSKKPAPVQTPAPAATKPAPSLQEEISKIIANVANAAPETKKAAKSAIVTDASEFVYNVEANKAVNVLVFYLPYVWMRENRALLVKIVNEIQDKRKQFVFPIAKRTIINKKSDFKQKIPRSRTLTSVYDSILEDLIFPAYITGRRMRYRSNGSLLTKVQLPLESEEFLKNKTKVIAELYFKLTNRKIVFEFKPEITYSQIPKPRKTHARKAQPKKTAA